MEVTLSGSLSGQLIKKCLEDPDACISGSVALNAFAGAKFSGKASATDSATGVTFSGNVSGNLGIEGSGTASLQGCLSSGITMSVCGKIDALANLSGSLSGTVAGQPVSKSFNASADTPIAAAGNCGGSPAMISRAAGVHSAGPVPLDSGPIVTNIYAEDILTSQDNLAAALGINSTPHSGVCAQIQLQLNQSAVLTRDAFLATLQLGNSRGDALTNISVSLVVQNQAGVDVTSLFGLETPFLSGSLSAVDGTGMLPMSSTGTAEWTLIPTLDAAPQTATNYLVSGSLSYTQDGNVVTIPLTPQTITVQPSPQLYLKYFLQRDVYADDPFTPEIEPSVPFPLAVMIQNKGYGLAQNFQITSAQPQIVDNQKGLLINFSILNSEVDGQEANPPSLTANFGDIAPGAIKIGEWWMISSLEGLFTSYSATFHEVDPLGNPRLDLIQGVEVHEINHVVQADGAWDDGQPDFLVIDTNDVNSLPNSVYLSDGTVQPVSVVQTGTAQGTVSTNNLQVQLTADFPAGFTYLLIADPANGGFPLANVLYTNGTSFLTNNFWITDRTFIGQGLRPLLQTNLHLFVYHTNAGPDTFTLVYETATNSPQTNPPVSAVYSLPAESPPTFGVVWSGAPNAGGASIAYYDIYASDNGGPFVDWQSQSKSTSALYNGVNGHTYAFYSVATDTAGNRESAPLQAQAQTTVALNTNPPTINVVSATTVLAGQTLSLGVIASDSNPLNTLTFSLGNGAPSGMYINPSSGLVKWTTSPDFGGTTNVVNVIVRDNGQPQLSATGSVAVAVLPAVYPATLVVQEAGNTLINNSPAASFGGVSLGTNASESFIIYNSGFGALVLSNLSLAGANAGDFNLSGVGLPTIIPAGGATNFTVTFTPSFLGAENALFQMANNDTNNDPFTIALSGVGVRVVPAINLTSSVTPSGFKDNITFTATVTGSGTTPTGTIQFATNGTAFGAPLTLSSSPASFSTAALPRGTNFIMAAYSGDPVYQSNSIILSQVVTNHPPVAGNVYLTHAANVPLLINIDNLLTNVTDVDGDAITLVGAGTDGLNMLSTNGTTLFNNFNFLFYTNSVTPNVNDSFDYTVTDGQGGTNEGTIFITMDNNIVGQSNVRLNINGTNVVANFFGIPGYRYSVERSTNLLAGSRWVSISTNTAPVNGLIQVQDNFTDLGIPIPPLPTPVYYRLRYNP